MPRKSSVSSDSGFNARNFTVIPPKPEAGSSWAGMSREQFAEWHRNNVGRIVGSKQIGALADSKPTAREAYIQRNKRENSQLVRVMGRMRG